MKIDFVTDTFPPDVNGAAMTLGRLVTGLKIRGHRLHVIRTGEPAADWQTTMRSLPLPGYQEVRIGLPGPFRLRKRWLRERPEVIYVATESPLGHSAVKAARALGIPVVSGFHTNFQQYMEPYHLAIRSSWPGRHPPEDSKAALLKRPVWPPGSRRHGRFAATRRGFRVFAGAV